MISVCLALYNGATYLKEQVSSILLQLDIDDELIISDDGSTDNSLLILESFNDKRIILINHVKTELKYNKGHYYTTLNFENALGKAKGDYVFLADQDDIWEPNKVKTIISYLRVYTLVMSNYSIINSNGKMIEKRFCTKSPINELFLLNIFHMPFHGCCMAFRRDLLDIVLPFPNHLIMHDNWIGLLAFLNRKEIGFINEPLVQYRRHEMNVSSSKGKSQNSFLFKFYYRMVLFYQLIYRFLN